MMKRYFWTILLFLSVGFVTAQENSTTFFQKVKTDVRLPVAAGENVIKLFNAGDAITILTENGIYTKKQNEEWTQKIANSKFITVCLDEDGSIWAISNNEIVNENGRKIPVPEEVRKDTITVLFWDSDNFYVGTVSGLYVYDGNWSGFDFTKGKRINAIANGAKDELWVATNSGLLNYSNKKWLNLDDNLMAVGNHANYFALASKSRGNDIIYSSLFSVGCIDGDGENWVLSGANGLPYGPVTTIRSYNNILWFGTKKGAIKKDDEWHYFLGKRWLCEDQVNDILILDEHTVWIASPKGISQIQEVEMTLEEKAAIYEEVIKKRHDRRGLVNVSQLVVPGDISTSEKINGDNDGLWTSTYLIAECFRYAVTGSNEAKEKAIKTYEALEWLEAVTGIPGLPARSYAMQTDSVVQSRSPHPKKWRPSPNPDWQWLDDTSSDEMVGHVLGIALFYDLVADSDFKIRAKNHMERIMDHIIDNEFHLMDYDGKPTRWGVWNPDSINNSPNWIYERGLYSLEILSFLKAAVHVTGNAKYEQTYQKLIRENHYAENTLEAKRFGPYENSRGENILTFFPYYGMLNYARDDSYMEVYLKSLERTWLAVKPDKMPVWNIISSVGLNNNCDLDIAFKQLKEYPLDLIDWTMQNSHRWDLQEDQLVDHSGLKQAVVAIPPAESGISRWNTNPRRFDTGTGGAREETGTYFLFAYWMARYHGFIND